MKRIIYPTLEGGVAVIIPAETVELALKDVPEGVPYEIVDADEIPSWMLLRLKRSGKRSARSMPLCKMRLKQQQPLKTSKLPWRQTNDTQT